jgi:arsenite-transporting ATPase
MPIFGASVFAGIEEYALLMGIEDTLRKKIYDYVIFDTPPTGLTLRFLALPSITLTWIERLIPLRQKILEKRYTIRRIRGNQSTSETTLAYDESEDAVLATLQSLHNNYRQLNATLQGRDCSVVLVFNPDILSLRESERLIQGLDDLKLPLRLLIHNTIIS